VYGDWKETQRLCERFLSGSVIQDELETDVNIGDVGPGGSNQGLQ